MNGLLKELTFSIYEYILKGKIPTWPTDLQSLVEYGLAQFKDGSEHHKLHIESPPVQIKEPLALVSITRYLEIRDDSVDEHIRAALQRSLDDSGKGVGFERAIILALTRLLQDGNKTLQDILQFHGDKPSWADKTVQIVVQTSASDFQPFSMITDKPVVPSSGITYHARDLQTVHNWVQKGGPGWCIPGALMGPDLLVWVRLCDKKILLLAIQAKCYFTGNNTTLTPSTALDAIRSITPCNFWQSSVCKLFSASRLVFIVAASRSKATTQPSRRHSTGLLRCSQILTSRKGLQMGNTIYCESSWHTHSPSTSIRKVFKKNCR